MISLNFYETILESSLQTRFMFDIKEIIINRCANNIPGETQDDLLRIAIDLPEFRGIPKEGRITDYSKAESIVRFATLRYFSTQFVIHFVTFHYDMTTWN